MTKGVILLSGGLDSVVSLAKSKSEYNIQLALTFDYGQRAVIKEIEVSKSIAEYFNIEHKVIEIPFLKEITRTSLVNTSQTLPRLKSDDLDNLELTENSAKNVWVPNRNGLFLNIAASFADAEEFTHIIFGANKEEGTTFPDNTQEFIDKINASFEFSTLVKPKVMAPLINLDKTEIIRLALEISAPLNLVRSCYLAEEKHCGKCESCLRLSRALQSNGKTFADFGI
jgi:7-cyano-7-deazaguanine synthase